MGETIIEYPDGSMRIDADVVRDEDETRLRAALRSFYGEAANLDPVVTVLKKDAQEHPGDLSILLRPIGWERSPSNQGSS